MPRCRAILRPRRSSISNVQFRRPARRIAADSPASRPGIERSSGRSIERSQVCSRIAAASGATPARGSSSRSSRTTMPGTDTVSNRPGSSDSRPIRDSAINGPASDTTSEIKSRRAARPPTPRQDNRQQPVPLSASRSMNASWVTPASFAAFAMVISPAFEQGECKILVEAHLQEPAPEWQTPAPPGLPRLVMMETCPASAFAHQRTRVHPQVTHRKYRNVPHHPPLYNPVATKRST